MCTFGAFPAEALLIDVTDPAATHFGNFPNVNYPGDYSNISRDFVSDPDERDFGWHYSPSDGTSISGIFLSNPYNVTSLRFQVHSSPFKDFLLQGSNNSTNGFDGIWSTLLEEQITELSEQSFQSWDFNNENSYSAYRIQVLTDYKNESPNFPIGWAMYRWELLADDGNVVPEPSTILLFSAGMMGIWARKRK
jgi:hypothetical protein